VGDGALRKEASRWVQSQDANAVENMREVGGKRKKCDFEGRTVERKKENKLGHPAGLSPLDGREKGRRPENAGNVRPRRGGIL